MAKVVSTFHGPTMKLIEWSKHGLICQSSKNFDKKVTVWPLFGNIHTNHPSLTLSFFLFLFSKVYEMQLKFKSKFDWKFSFHSYSLLHVSFFSEDDFKTDVDLRVACLILDKQVKLINGNEANILTPHVWLKKYLDDQGKGIERQESITRPIVELQSMSKTFSEKRMIICLSFFAELEAPKVIQTVNVRPRIMPKTSTISLRLRSSFYRWAFSFLASDEDNTCVLCLTTERQIACLPCGHLTSCVACGHSLKTCPICRAPVKAFVRIYTWLLSQLPF